MSESNWQNYGGVDQDKPDKEVVDVYDRLHGAYDGSKSEGGKPKVASTPLPAEPSPFNITGS